MSSFTCITLPTLELMPIIVSTSDILSKCIMELRKH